MRTAVCAVVKNEEKYIGEWIAHHLVTGFDTILIYDNDSSDSTAEYINKAALAADIRVVPWITKSPDFQVRSYEAGFEALKAEVDWMLFIDIDEFFIPKRDGDVKTFLRNFGKDVHAIAVPELFYGTNGLVDSSGDLVSRSYVRRAPDDFGPNRNVKSFIRPETALKASNPHLFSICGNYTGVDGERVVWIRDGVTESVRRPDIACVNHYFTRSRQDWDMKMARGHQDGTTRSESDFEYYDRNDVLDETAASYASAVEDILVRFEGFKPSSYLRANPDVAELKMDPRQHYFQHGRKEGRPLRLQSPHPISRLRHATDFGRFAKELDRRLKRISNRVKTVDNSKK